MSALFYIYNRCSDLMTCSEHLMETCYVDIPLMLPVPDLPLCLSVHRTPMDREEPIFLPFCFTMDICLCGVILNLKAFCSGAIPDIMIEFIV